MIPTTMNFHDASLMTIVHEGCDLVLTIEDATIGTSREEAEHSFEDADNFWKTRNGTLTLAGVPGIEADGHPVRTIEPEGDWGEILAFESTTPGQVKFLICWCRNGVRAGDIIREYRVQCADIRWSEAAP